MRSFRPLALSLLVFWLLVLSLAWARAVDAAPPAGHSAAGFSAAALTER